ncbi:MAG: phosphoribosylformylglycinamidine synthase subunit PurQ [bacterium]
MKAGIVVFPGTNCDNDTLRACEKVGWNAEFIWHDETSVSNYDVIFLPGGFSYGDYISAGRLAKFSPIMNSIKKYIDEKRGIVIGICNGFQILCESGILPGALGLNLTSCFICKDIELTFHHETEDYIKIKLPIAHGEGRYIADEATLEKLEQNQMIFLEYKNNINGSINDIAGIIDRKNKVIGMMPHPERAVFEEIGNIDGKKFFKFIEALANENN